MTLDELGRNLPALFCALLVSILFIQSGLDKIFDWKGKLCWLTGHFSKTFLNGTVPMMLATLFVNAAGFENPGFAMSFGQMSEVLFMLVMPLFFARLGVKCRSRRPD
mgnify:CR=1 FL=1